MTRDTFKTWGTEEAIECSDTQSTTLAVKLQELPSGAKCPMISWNKTLQGEQS